MFSFKIFFDGNLRIDSPYGIIFLRICLAWLLLMEIIIYDGIKLVQRGDIVFVGINYRLGRSFPKTIGIERTIDNRAETYIFF